MTDREFYEKLQGSYHQLTASEKLVADYLSHNLQKASFLTCIELGRTVGVSDSTVIRLANVLGFTGFAQLKKTLQGMVLKKLSAQDRLSTTIAAVEGSNYLEEIFELEKFNLDETCKLNPQAVIDQAVEMLDQARKIFVVGLGISGSLSRFFCARLSRIKRDVVEINSGGSVFVEKMALADSRDVLLAFSFPRYALEKVKLFRYMREDVGGKTMLVTDRRLGPVQAQADLILLANSDSLAFMNSITGAAMLANMLSVGLALKSRDQSLAQLSRNQKLADLLGHSFSEHSNNE